MKRYVSILLALPFLLFSSCRVEYYDVAEEELRAPEGLTDMLPQEGVALSLDLRYEPATKFQPGIEFRQYRYRVLIDGWEYCYGVTDGEYYQPVAIPIMANDTYSPVSIVVEGSKALDYEKNPKGWEAWHALYRVTQGCLPAGEAPVYDGLKDRKLKVTIDGQSFLFDIRDTGAGQVFKRLLSGRTVTLSVCLNDFISIDEDPEGFHKKLGNHVPPCFGMSYYKHKVGEICLERNGWIHICLKDKEMYSYDTILGSVRQEDLKALKKLYPGSHDQVKSTMTMSLTGP